MARSRWAAFAVLASIMLAACSGGGDKSAAEGVVGDPKAGAGSAMVARSFEDLSEALDLAVPGGYMVQPDAVGDTGPSDLEKAVRDGGDDARDVLTRTGFVRGYQRMWAHSRGEEIVSYVYQFAQPAGAAEYTQRVSAAAGAPAEGVSIDVFRVSGIADSKGVNVTAAASASSSVIFVKGPYSVEVVVNSVSPAGLESLVTALAEEQYSRL